MEGFDSLENNFLYLVNNSRIIIIIIISWRAADRIIIDRFSVLYQQDFHRHSEGMVFRRNANPSPLFSFSLFGGE